ncbi:Peroxisomal membrane protein pex16 [Tulasnella sp. 403]|nr:Peroxisomal membrane protein pex16 [Tulasnella sp. 403]
MLATMPTSALARYESLLISNASTINTIESSIRSLTWFLPGRFKDAELASEALSAVLNLLSLYHDTLLARRLKAEPKLRPIIPPSPHSRYTHAWADKDAGYKWAARMLEIVKFVELVFEMTLRRTFKAKQRTVWKAIVCVETVKAFLKLFLLAITRRPVLSPPIPEREIDPASLSDLSPEDTTVSSSHLLTSSSPPAHLKNNKVPLPTPATSKQPSPLLAASPQSLQQQQAIEEYLLPKALTTIDVKRPLSLVRPLATYRDWVSEMIYLFRPLIYVLALARSSRYGRQSSSPLVLSLSLELLAHYLRRPAPLSFALERQEYARRDRDLLWYFLRGVVWTDFTQPKLKSIIDATQNVPLLSVVGAFMQDWMPLIDQYYYFTAT